MSVPLHYDPITHKKVMNKIKLPKAPEGYKYSIQRDWDSKHHVVWLHSSFSFSYTTKDIKSIWGFIRKKDMKIVSPINSKKPGNLAVYVTPYSAMKPPIGASCISVTHLVTS